jgi:hypothetical protein
VDLQDTKKKGTIVMTIQMKIPSPPPELCPEVRAIAQQMMMEREQLADLINAQGLDETTEYVNSEGSREQVEAALVAWSQLVAKMILATLPCEIDFGVVLYLPGHDATGFFTCGDDRHLAEHFGRAAELIDERTED